MTRPIAALTGATGFLGRHIARALEDAGFRVRILIRRETPSAEEIGPASELVFGDLANEEALAHLVGDAEVTVHAAGLVKARRPEDFLQVNVEGSRRLALAMARGAPDARLVLVSSITAREPALSAYGASKAAAEAAVRQVLKPDRYTIVRPPAIYGPGDRETLALFKAVRTLPIAPLAGGPEARVAMIHVDDAAAQVSAIAGRPAEGATYTLADARPEGYAWIEIMQAAARAMNRRPRFVQLPRAGVLAIGRLGGALGGIGGRTPMITLGKAREMLHADWSVAAHERLPSPPTHRFDLDGGFAHAVAWYRSHHWL